MMKRVFISFITSAFFIAALSSPAYAQQKPAHVLPQESLDIYKQLAATPELAPEIAKLDALLDEQLKKLSPKGADTFKGKQEHWRINLTKACNAALEAERKACQLDEVKRREYSLKNMIIQAGGRTFVREEYSYEIPVADDPRAVLYKTVYADDNVHKYFSWPQIDGNPLTKAEEEWNELVKSQTRADVELGDCEGRFSNQDVSFEFGYTSDNFISIVYTKNWQCPGGSSGWPSQEVKNYILAPHPREMSVADIFDLSSDWSPKLAPLTDNELEKKNGGPQIEEAERMLAQGENWLLTPDGIDLNFRYVNGHAGGVYHATIPWEAIKPFLQPHRAFKLPFEK